METGATGTALTREGATAETAATGTHADRTIYFEQEDSEGSTLFKTLLNKMLSKKAHSHFDKALNEDIDQPQMTLKLISLLM